MKVRRPRFLTPRRKYEVDETSWLVKWGRPKLASTLTLLQRIPPAVRMLVITMKWGRIPKSWELSFVDKMNSLEGVGISFREVLKEHLPSVLGEAPSEVLGVWLGRSARTDPKAFVKAVEKTFGPSAKGVIVRLSELANPEAMLEERKPVEAPYQSLIDVINATDG